MLAFFFLINKEQDVQSCSLQRGSIWLLLLSFPSFFNSCVFPKHFKTNTRETWTLVYPGLCLYMQNGKLCAPAKAKMWEPPLETWPKVGEIFLSPSDFLSYAV